MEKVNYFNNWNSYSYWNNPTPTCYYPDWGNYEDFSYASTENVIPPPSSSNVMNGFTNAEAKSSLEEALTLLRIQTSLFRSESRDRFTRDEANKPSLEEALTSFISQSNAFMSETRSCFARQDARMDKIELQMTQMASSIKNLETQVGQLLTIVGGQQQKSQFSSTTEANSKEQCSAIHQKSGTEYEEPKILEKQESSEPNTDCVSMHFQPVCGVEKEQKQDEEHRNSAWMPGQCVRDIIRKLFHNETNTGGTYAHGQHEHNSNQSVPTSGLQYLLGNPNCALLDANNAKTVLDHDPKQLIYAFKGGTNRN